MTIAYPDVSNHNGAMPLQDGTVACFAKSSEGTGYRDPYYLHFKVEAERVGALFGAYHFLRQGDGAGQARFAYSIVGPDVPMMIDFEPEYDAGGNPISLPSVADAVAFRDTYRSLGGLVRLNYLPRWYWAGHLGSPSLAPLADLALVSSGYTTYSDTGPGWASYGGLTPAVWQWTDKQPYSGQQVDFNAYRGTVDELAVLLGLAGADMQWTDVINGPNGRPNGNSVADILTDLGRLRDALVGDQTALSAYPAGSPLRQILAVAAGFPDLSAKVAALGAPVDVKTLAADLAAIVQPTITAAVQAGITPEADQLALAFEQHLAATLAQGK